MNEIRSITSKRHIAILVMLSDIDTDVRLRAVKIVKTIKGMAWVIIARFKKYNWSQKEMAFIRKYAKDRWHSLRGTDESAALKQAWFELSCSFNETLYLNLRNYGA